MIRSKYILFTGCLFALAAGVLALLVFLPREYHTPALQKRAGTQFWTLSTGSVIAYTFIPGKGKKKAYPLIYLHGGPGAGITRLEIERLTPLTDEGYDLYLYDQIGCGHSGRLNNIREYSAERHNKDLEAIVKQLHAEKVILLAQSWGSILAMLYLADHPDKVAKIAITAPGPIQPGHAELAGVPSPDSLQLKHPVYTGPVVNEKNYNIRTRAILYFARKFGKKLCGDREADQLATLFTNDLNKTMVCDPDKAVHAEGTEGFYVHYMTRMSLGKVRDPRPKIKNLPVPVLIMKGQCDNQPWGYTTEYLKLFPHHRLSVIPQAGHNIFIEQPGLYLEAIRSFLHQGEK